MLSLPAFVAALVGSYAQSKALLAQKHVAAVTGVNGDNRVIFGELADISLFFVFFSLCVVAALEVTGLAAVV